MMSLLCSMGSWSRNLDEIPTDWVAQNFEILGGVNFCCQKWWKVSVFFLWLYKFPFGLEENFTKNGDFFLCRSSKIRRTLERRHGSNQVPKFWWRRKSLKKPAVHSSVFFQNDHWKKYEQKLFDESTWIGNGKKNNKTPSLISSRKLGNMIIFKRIQDFQPCLRQATKHLDTIKDHRNLKEKRAWWSDWNPWCRVAGCVVALVAGALRFWDKELERYQGHPYQGAQLELYVKIHCFRVDPYLSGITDPS